MLIYLFCVVDSAATLFGAFHPLAHSYILKKENKSISRSKMYIEIEKIDF